LSYLSTTERASGNQIVRYRCTYCGLEFKEYRPNHQITR
jgi:hypothetical protein